MKYFIICFVLFATSGIGQIKPKPTYCPSEPYKSYSVKSGDTIFVAAAVTLKPKFPGGFEAFNKLFAAEFKNPTENPDRKGRIFLSCIVEKDGTLTNIKVLRDFGKGTGAEAIRVIKKMPKWSPAELQQKIVRCSFSLPIKIPYEPLSQAQLKIDEIPDKH